MKAIVSEKGQVTIPRGIRKCLGIVPGTVIEFEEREGLLVGRKQEPAIDAVGRVTGILRKRREVDDYLAETRGPGP